MLSIKKILLPVDFPDTSLRVIHQATTLARRFHSEIVMLHVVTAASHRAGVPVDDRERDKWDMIAKIVERADGDAPEFDGLTVRRILIKGGAAQAIVHSAQRGNVDLIMLPAHGHTFNQFLLGSATPNLLNGAECPVWAGTHMTEIATGKFAIGSVLCTVDFSAHDQKTLEWAAHIAAEFGARLTLAHIAADVEHWGPGGTYVHSKRQQNLVADAKHHIAALCKKMNIHPDIFVGCGDPPKVLNEAAKQTKADLLVTGCRPYGGQLRTHGYPIISAMPIPVLCV